MRIYIFTQQQLCAKCKAECEKYDGLEPDCEVCSYKKLPHTPSNKALAKMRAAVEPFVNGFDEITHIGGALEAALCALVGVKK